MPNLITICLASIAALCGLLFGFDTGVISGALLFIKSHFHLSTLSTELLVSIVLAGAMLGAIISGKLADHYGRRLIMFITAWAFVIGTLLSTFATTLNILLIGRLLVGVAIGIASYIAPLYISEISPAKNRGALVIINTITVTGGIVIAYLVDLYFTPTGAWRWMLGVGVVPAMMLVLLVWRLPQSPRWLMQHGWYHEAKHVLQKIRPQHEVEFELQQIQKLLQQKQTYFKDLFNRRLWPILLLGCFLALVQQFSGINTILYYAPLIFKTAGFKSNSAALLATLGMGITNFLMTLVAMWLVDKVGRRPLLLIGLAVMSLSLTVVAYLFNQPHQHGILLLCALMSFVAFYAISIGCLFWLIISEIYPLYLRGRAMSIATVCNWGANMLVAATFLSLLNHLGGAVTFSCYAIFSACSFVICYYYLPETKNLSLEVIESNLNSGQKLKWLGLTKG